MKILTPEQSQDYDIVRALAEQATHKNVCNIKILRGRNSYNYLIDDHIILKLPQSEETATTYPTIAQNAPVLQEHLSVQIPQPSFHILDIHKNPTPALTYECIDGQTMTRIQFHEKSQHDREYYMDQLAQIIHEIHLIPTTQLPVIPPSAFQIGTQKLFATSPLLASVSHEVLRRIFASDSGPLAHFDLHSDNVCTTPKSKIVGIIDLEGIVRGKPYLSFRPTLYSPKNLEYLTSRYISSYPHELSRVQLKAFQSTYNSILSLCCFAQFVCGKRKEEIFDRVQDHRLLTKMFREYDRK